MISVDIYLDVRLYQHRREGYGFLDSLASYSNTYAWQMACRMPFQTFPQSLDRIHCDTTLVTTALQSIWSIHYCRRGAALRNSRRLSNDYKLSWTLIFTTRAEIETQNGRSQCKSEQVLLVMIIEGTSHPTQPSVADEVLPRTQEHTCLQWFNCYR